MKQKVKWLIMACFLCLILSGCEDKKQEYSEIQEIQVDYYTGNITIDFVEKKKIITDYSNSEFTVTEYPFGNNEELLAFIESTVIPELQTEKDINSEADVNYCSIQIVTDTGMIDSSKLKGKDFKCWNELMQLMGEPWNITTVNLVSVQEFIEYYNFANEDISEDYIEAYIEEYEIAPEMLDDENYDEKLVSAFELGLTYGHDILTLLSAPQINLEEDDDLTDLEYLIMINDIFTGVSDLTEQQFIIIDAKEGKYYYSENDISRDYTEAEVIKDISTEEINEYISSLRSIISPEWEHPVSIGDQATYLWDLYLVKRNGKIIKYMGEGVDEEKHPGLHDWYQNLANF